MTEINSFILHTFTMGEILISVLLFMIVVLLFAVVTNTSEIAKNTQIDRRRQENNKE